ncbi:MAG: HAD-IIIA family hydrolase [Anaerolineaceae bacterium]|nr:HAD-IIIA family hydrolase [Anaerolineaceae bacterium]
MENPILAILFDVGGTLRISSPDEELRESSLSQIKDLIAWTGTINELEISLRSRESQYRTWCQKTLIELTEVELWSKFMLSDQPFEFVNQNALILNQLWRSRRVRNLYPDVKETLQQLSEKGYKLGIISNTTSSVEVPQLVKDASLENFISCVILSTTFGKRKPHPALFLSAAKQMNIAPENCAYIGNDPTRDLIGARQAGFGLIVLVKKNGYMNFNPDEENDYVGPILEIKADYMIDRLGELQGIFPKLSNQINPEDVPYSRYNAALSTMWNVDQNIPFYETFKIGHKIGFSRFELNHKVSPELYASYNHNQFYISTIHEPCPTPAPYEELKLDDLAISSLDENKRIRGVDMIKASIDLAIRLGSRSIVIHPGSIVCDKTNDYRLRELYQENLQNTSEYQALLDEVVADRKIRVQPHFDQVMQSMEELIGFARGSGIALGLENRFRYYDIPLPDEMEMLLNLCPEDWFGFQYDVGHAQTLSALGQVDHYEWLERFACRMVGVHLHDVRGVIDHHVPGTGDVDFVRISKYLPIHAQRTLEINPKATLEELVEGLRVLAESGCIEKL